MSHAIRNGDDIHPLRAILSYVKRRKHSKEREDGVFLNHFQWISHLTLQEYWFDFMTCEWVYLETFGDWLFSLQIQEVLEI